VARQRVPGVRFPELEFGAEEARVLARNTLLLGISVLAGTAALAGVGGGLFLMWQMWQQSDVKPAATAPAPAKSPAPAFDPNAKPLFPPTDNAPAESARAEPTPQETPAPATAQRAARAAAAVASPPAAGARPAAALAGQLNRPGRIRRPPPPQRPTPASSAPPAAGRRAPATP
jgi:hypothetical protein